MLVASTALATDNAFADKKKGGYKKSQAVSQVNDCGNGEIPDKVGLTTKPIGPIDVWCQNLASQIQGDDNSPALPASQGEEENGDMVR
jgi:hypothetical protein